MDKLAAARPRLVKATVCEMSGFCYLRYFTGGRRWAAKNLWGRHGMSAWVLWMLSDLWREDIGKVELVDVGRNLKHASWNVRGKRDKGWHKVQLRLGVPPTCVVGASR